MRLRQVDHIQAVDARHWDACFADPSPFLEHAFLAALEAHGCVTPKTGWTPCHAVLEDDDHRIIGAAPLYLKAHSYGEFVFDFSWAQASHQLGQRYYPKLLCAVPFTPVAGPRLGARDAQARQALALGLRDLAADQQRSSLHALFLNPPDRQALATADFIERSDVQFHWYNAGYANFEAFLATLNHDKRKKIRRERRRVAEAGLQHRWQRGDELDEAQWAEVYALYANTYAERGQLPYLSLDFFLDYGRRPGTPIRLASAFDGPRRVAVAITFAGDNTLYGRHWGAAQHYHSLHFETCYYQGIEYCIGKRMRHFDAGAQGAHKLARGFMPEVTHSAHWLADPRLAAAVRRAMQHERTLVDGEARYHGAHGPYKRET